MSPGVSAMRVARNKLYKILRRANIYMRIEMLKSERVYAKFIPYVRQPEVV